jgi:hypothetical protein
MATQIKFRGGTTAEHLAFIGSEREMTIDTTKETVVVHDGVTAGGFPLARESSSQSFTCGALVSTSVTTGGIVSSGVTVAGAVAATTVTGDGSGLTGIIPVQTGLSGRFLTTDGTAVSWVVADHSNDYADSLAFSTSTGILTVGRTGSLVDLTVDLDGKYSELAHTHSGVYAPNSHTHGLSDLTTSGSASSSTFLRGDGAWSTVSTFPSQSGNAGEFLTTDGSSVSWATVDALPTQTSHAGKFLTTSGSAASWATVDALPSQTSQSGKFLTTDGSTASWDTVSSNATNLGMFEHAHTISANYSITSTNNAITAGPISIGASVSITVPATSTWVIV